MITLSRVILPVITLSLVAACATNTRIQSNYDSDVDLSQYKTFGFSSQTEFEDSDLAGDLELYFSAAVMQELHAKGLAESDDPDILINVSVDLEEVSRAPLRGTICPRYEDYYSREFNFSYGGFTGESRRTMCIYTEGQVIVKLMDAARNQSIMEGVSRVRLDKNDRGANLLLSASYDVATMFGESPARDGRPTSSMASNYSKALDDH